MIRVAAVGDLHIGDGSAAPWQRLLTGVAEAADLLLLAGDLTQRGTRQEEEQLVALLRGVDVPTLAVLGNHDYDAGRAGAIARALEAEGVRVLEGSHALVHVGSTRVGVVGSKGFGGGFAGACGSEFGEPEMKAFLRCTRTLAQRLHAALAAVEADVRIVLLHCSPIPETLLGERREIYPFLGSHLLGEAIDLVGADLVLHGHAHAGQERGWTAGGVPVRNVAQPVIEDPYRVYRFGGG